MWSYYFKLWPSRKSKKDNPFQWIPDFQKYSNSPRQLFFFFFIQMESSGSCLLFLSDSRKTSKGAKQERAPIISSTLREPFFLRAKYNLFYSKAPPTHGREENFDHVPWILSARNILSSFFPAESTHNIKQPVCGM